jgi:predicted transcriptional regulator
MAGTTTITVRVTAELKERLDRLATLTDRSRSYLAAEALEIYARQELEVVEGVLEGIADDEAGRVVPHEEAMARLDRVIAEAGKSRRSA